VKLEIWQTQSHAPQAPNNNLVKLEIWQTQSHAPQAPNNNLVKLEIWQTQSAKSPTSQKNPCEERSDEASEKMHIQ
jgi:hypothetical protein